MSDILLDAINAMGSPDWSTGYTGISSSGPSLTELLSNTAGPEWSTSYPSSTMVPLGSLTDSGSGLSSFLNSDIGKALTKLGAFAVSPQGIVSIAGTALGMSGAGRPRGGGWQGTVPTNLVATRERKPMPEYKPYQRSTAPVMGRRYFGDISYAPPAAASTTAPASAVNNDAATGIATLPNSSSANTQSSQPATAQTIAAPDIPYDQVAQTGKIPLARGGIAGHGRYLRGTTDGMADKIPSSIEGKQPAALSHGEFVIPADVVSHLGNGNSDAGADVLYKMMDRVRHARTGTKKQGKQIKPEKFVPGGIAQLASGGAVKHFDAGGLTTTGSTGSTATKSTGLTTSPTGVVQSGALAPWVGDYASDYLGRGLALSKEPFQAYEGALSAGVSPIQSKAFGAAEGIAGTQFDPSKFMNPYLSGALQPQLDALRREADINQAKLQGQFTKAGAFGGARETLARTENMRNLGDLQYKVLGQGYKDAYDRAVEAFFKEQGQEVTDLAAMLKAGEAERAIEQEGITAQKAAFEEERQDPFTKLKFAQSLLSGLPTGTQTTEPNLSTLQQLGISARDAGDFVKWLQDNILNKPATNSGTTTTPTTQPASTSGTQYGGLPQG